MKKKLLFMFVVLLFMVLAATYLGTYSTAYSKWGDPDRITGPIASINYETMKLSVYVPGFPYSWYEDINANERTNISYIYCDGKEHIKTIIDFNDLEIGMYIEAGTNPADYAYLIKVFDGPNSIPCK